MRREGFQLGSPARDEKAEHCASDTGSNSEMRCCCGNLLARLVAGILEVKCRRCKRTIALSVVVDSPETAGKGT